MKILSIGNSFSEDAQRWLHSLGEQNGVCIDCANLYIGGCSLEAHHINNRENNAFYDLEINGVFEGEKTSIASALEREEWDVITLQQVSGFSGIANSYDPYLNGLVEFIKEKCRNAKIVIHGTWAYETDSQHPDFPKYNNNQKEMFNRIISATAQKAKEINAEIIPVGKVIQHLRENVKDFDYENGGLSLCRDGFHLSFDYGRFAAAATWVRFLLNKPLKDSAPCELDTQKALEIIAAVNAVFEKM